MPAVDDACQSEWLHQSTDNLCFKNQHCSHFSAIWANCLSWLCEQHTLLSVRHTWPKQKPVCCCRTEAWDTRRTQWTAKKGTRGDRSYRKIRHDGNEKTSCTQGGGSDETQVQEDNHTGGKPDETDRRPKWNWKCTKSQDHLVLQTLLFFFPPLSLFCAVCPDCIALSCENLLLFVKFPWINMDYKMHQHNFLGN